MSITRGQILFTRDGRVMGNAIVLRLDESQEGVIYRCRSDFGNTFSMLESELVKQFYTLRQGVPHCSEPEQHYNDQLEKLVFLDVSE